jgi:hypothetical protein
VKSIIAEEFAEISGRYLCDGYSVDEADELAAGYLAIKHGMRKEEFINYGNSIFRVKPLHETTNADTTAQGGKQATA